MSYSILTQKWMCPVEEVWSWASFCPLSGVPQTRQWRVKIAKSANCLAWWVRIVKPAQLTVACVCISSEGKMTWMVCVSSDYSQIQASVLRCALHFISLFISYAHAVPPHVRTVYLCQLMSSRTWWASCADSCSVSLAWLLLQIGRGPACIESVFYWICGSQVFHWRP